MLGTLVTAAASAFSWVDPDFITPATAEGDLCQVWTSKHTLSRTFAEISITSARQARTPLALAADVLTMYTTLLALRDPLPQVDAHSRIELAKRPTGMPNDGCAYGNQTKTAV